MCMGADGRGWGVAGAGGAALLVTSDRWGNLVSSPFTFFGYLLGISKKKIHLLLLISNRTSHGNTWVAYKSH